MKISQTCNHVRQAYYVLVNYTVEQLHVMSLLIRKVYFGLAYFKPFAWQQEENHLIFVNWARIDC